METQLKKDTMIKCIYRNESDHLAILRLSHFEQWLERVVESGQVYLFEANTNAHLEIYTYEMATMLLSARIPCYELVWTV